MSNSFIVVIPARYASSRFPGKPLVDIGGKPMIQHVYERSLQSGAKEVIIATDDARIESAAQQFGAKVCLTSTKHQSGTDRIAEVCEILGFAEDAVIVNVQGDEPLISPDIIRLVAKHLHSQTAADVATLCEPLSLASQLFAANIAKVIFDRHSFALFFSRAPIPWDRDHFPLDLAQKLPDNTYYRHLGIYAYRANYLRYFITLKPCAIELIECLEQLRMLWNGAKIYVGVVNACTMIGVDTPQDLEKVRAMVMMGART